MQQRYTVMYMVQNASFMLWNGRTARSIGSWKFVVINFSSETSASSKPEANKLSAVS